MEIDVVIATPAPLDVDSKYVAPKHLLDSLVRPKSNLALFRQHRRQKRGLFIPLGVIWDDSDGEAGMDGCVRRFTVIQQLSMLHAVTITIQEVLP
ncbi:hypothetical protein BOO71_0000646 [Deinococcus marmoris]|uniref:Uncharacterized protein n=1 Tax=Deinococcus marmoris TaxID=249408 RepID=A0A1U7P4X2_9DEIO|nr:hypothetical protein BOO71_0000646 [Deinococcus marmoris]